MPNEMPGEVTKILNAVADFIEGSGKPGPGGVDITGGVPSEVYVAIGRDRYDTEYEVAEDTAEAVRRNLATYFRSPVALAALLQKITAPTLTEGG